MKLLITAKKQKLLPYFNFCKFLQTRSYRVSHGKVNKVIWLCWGYSFWFLLIFWVLCVHEKGTFMLNSSVFIFLMLRALYRMICKNLKSFFGKNSLNVQNVNWFYWKIIFDFYVLSCRKPKTSKKKSSWWIRNKCPSLMNT